MLESSESGTHIPLGKRQLGKIAGTDGGSGIPVKGNGTATTNVSTKGGRSHETKRSIQYRQRGHGAQALGRNTSQSRQSRQITAVTKDTIGTVEKNPGLDPEGSSEGVKLQC
jgi:hypothetical protein